MRYCRSWVLALTAGLMVGACLCEVEPVLNGTYEITSSTERDLHGLANRLPLREALKSQATKAERQRQRETLAHHFNKPLATIIGYVCSNRGATTQRSAGSSRWR